jgi:hypothetical protein
MCLAIVNIKGSIPRGALFNAWKANPDGAGLLYVSGRQLKDYKELKSFNLFYNFYMNLKIRNRKPILIHFRWATHGKKDLANCHPHYVDKKLGFIHNGVIAGVGYDKNKSDTVLFNEIVLQALPDDFLSDGETVEAIEDNIGNSKLAFLYNTGGIKIINERAGHWHEGNWYSNNSYRDKIVYRAPKHTPVQREWDWKYTPEKRNIRSSYTAPTLFDQDLDNYVDEMDDADLPEPRDCINCGSKHASYDDDLDCHICNHCRKTFLT